MSENPKDSSSAANAATVKRYSPPSQRSRSLSRRRSGGDRFERMNNRSTNDGENNQVPTSRNVLITDHGDDLGLIPLHGCCKSEASQLMNDRWAAAVKAFHDPSIDSAERPTMYSKIGASAWGQFRLPHQLMSRTGYTGLPGQKDFLSDLQRAIRDANASIDP